MARHLLWVADMRSNELRSVFRRVLALGLIPPAALAACGGGIAGDVPDDEDGGTPYESRPRTDRDAATLEDSATLTDGAIKRDASLVDAHVVDARVKDARADADADATLLDAGLDGCVSTQAPPPQDPDASFSCVWTVPLPCSITLDRQPSQLECQQYCGETALFCNASNGGSGGGGDQGWVLQCVSCAIGRRPEGFTSRVAVSAAKRGERTRTPVVGRFFEMAAELEAASVGSFERLELELEALGAPADLRRRARSAAADERRHARVTYALAARFGSSHTANDACASMRSDAVHGRALRDLVAVALENAVEGCVRETFGALTATMQADRATDPRVRAAMRRIATDETAHAALAWSIASWVSTKLDAETQERIRAAMSDAIDGLAREMATDPPAELQSVCGLPSSHEASSMLDGMRELLWAA